MGHINFRVKKLYICQTKTAKMYVQISTQIQLSYADNLILPFGKNRYVNRTNVVQKNVTTTVIICLKFMQKPTCKVIVILNYNFKLEPQ